MPTEAEKRLFSFEDLEKRWGISKYSARRLVVQGLIKSVTIGARRLVPLSEIERCEQFGVGTPRTACPKK